MPNFDEFAQILFEEAKRFYEKARDEISDQGKSAYLHAALNIGFCALEAHINSIADELAIRPDLNSLDKSILLERELRLQDGDYQLSGSLKMFRLEDRIQFIYRRFSGKALDRQTSWWSDLKAGLDLRNKISHPKESPVVKENDVQKALSAIIETLKTIYMATFHRDYPAAGRALDSNLNF
jgi:hypothetical protein